MKIVETFTAIIYVALEERDSGIVHTIQEVENICQEYCNDIGLCVTVTPTKFIYTDGQENGCAIGFINYPRFPDTQDGIKDKALELAKTLRDEFDQYKVSIVCNDKTYMLEREM
jgi:ferredoxin